jgi:hypothetical protein
MSLLDDLRGVSQCLDPQFQPSSNETGPLLGALIAYTEHGDKLLKAAGEDDGTAAVTELLAPAPKTTEGASAGETTKKGKGD